MTPREIPPSMFERRRIRKADRQAWPVAVDYSRIPPRQRAWAARVDAASGEEVLALLNAGPNGNWEAVPHAIPPATIKRAGAAYRAGGMIGRLLRRQRGSSGA